MSYWAPAVLTSVAGAMLALPLSPAVRELLHPRDAAALPIQQHDSRIENFAHAFREYIEPLLPHLSKAVARNTCRTICLGDGTEAVLNGACADETHFAESQDVDALMLFGCPVLLPDNVVCRRELYASGKFCGGRHSVFRAILGEHDINLGVGSSVLRWVHAEHHLQAASGCALHGRASAGHSILLATGCTFERVYAPRITTGTEAAADESGSAFGTGSTIDRRLGCFRVRGVLRLRSGEVLQGNLIARTIRLAEGCSVIGSLKASSDVAIESGTCVDGTIVAGAAVHIADGCRIRGPILAEGCVTLGRNTRVGTPFLPSTVSARRITMHSGATSYGTLWAREKGWVKP